MNPLLLFIKEEYIEFLSIDSNGRVLPVNFQSSNRVPLYFLINGDQIQMDEHAKSEFINNTRNSYGEFWKNTGTQSLSYNRFQKSYFFDTLLPYAIKETILPDIIKSHFHTSNFSDFIQQKSTFLLFDSFVEEVQKEIIVKGFLEIIGFAPNNLIILDYWELFKTYEYPKENAVLFINASLGNIYIHLVGDKHPFHVSKKIIIGKGRDPRLDTILDFIAEKTIARGSGLEHNELKNILSSEALSILEKLPNGFVQHTIRNNKLDVNPIKLDFNTVELDVRLNNKQSINYIQNDFDEFRRNNNASQLPIYLSGSLITQPVFLDFFKSTYNMVKASTIDSYEQFLKYVLKKCWDDNNTKNKIINKNSNNFYDTKQSENIVDLNISIPIQVLPKPKEVNPPILKTPPIVKTPPVVKVPPIPTRKENETIHKPATKVPPIVKPEIKMPAVTKGNKNNDVPIPGIKKAKVPPPPPPPPPPIKNK